MIDAYKEMYGKLPMQFQLESFEESKLGDYICDTVDDLKDLPEDCEMGSIARIIAPNFSDTYLRISSSVN